MLASLLEEIRACTHCAAHLPLGARPVLAAQESARVLIVGQAPGTKVHETGIPWNDASGQRLRAWMGVDRAAFYDASRFAIVPMGFCYPGRGKGSDLPPRPECAVLWRDRLHAALPHIELTLLIGQYAQDWYLGARRGKTLRQTVANWREYLQDGFLPLVHPSPRNRRWLANNPWFETEVVPVLQTRIRAYMQTEESGEITR